MIPEWGRSPGGRAGNPLQCSCLENPLDRGAWQATDHGVSKNRAQLSKHLQDFPLKILHPGNCLSPQSQLPYFPGPQLLPLHPQPVLTTASHWESPPFSNIQPSCPWAALWLPESLDFKCPRFTDISRLTYSPSQLDSGPLRPGTVSRPIKFSLVFLSNIQSRDLRGGLVKSSDWKHLGREDQ